MTATGDQPDGDDRRRVVLVLQGGGALGSYQAGVFEALVEAGLQPDWVAGVSIGAVNGSLIAGNPPEQRLERLREFWLRITAPTALWPRHGPPVLERLEQRAGALGALLFGQPGFFRPRLPFEWFTDTPPVSFYDTGALQGTLAELVDFERIARGPTRLTVGAVNVETGNQINFDSRHMRLGVEHVMASGALPPGLAVVEVEGEAFWDGGLVSNTPLQVVMDDAPREDSLIFQVDLFPARGPRPATLDEVLEREKDIRYSSRTRAGTKSASERQSLRLELTRFLDRLPAKLQRDPVAQHLRGLSCRARMDIVHLIYRPDVPQGSQKDFQFDRGTMSRRWEQGLADGRRTLQAAPWRAPVPAGTGVRVFDVTRPAPAR
ncbi:Patatin-like phospholipase family protein [Rhodovastum atsumiense]|uniref:Patatin-like phospholipase family protein n=1 Tax=Rhodovastum atsumiense TaxID=504468 RepID=A0A5M6IV91_9PROT|nr:patatin-like phospholipase family protein [Rhodovastum atsumiense]KAA5611468.1 patatin-like phospholipase family protein [Rhodovastum atsumiense]CAH2601156.1 Patatin-like phospholipase family protein [Rhodovastum atsumiense]